MTDSGLFFRKQCGSNAFLQLHGLLVSANFTWKCSLSNWLPTGYRVMLMHILLVILKGPEDNSRFLLPHFKNHYFWNFQPLYGELCLRSRCYLEFVLNMNEIIKHLNGRQIWVSRFYLCAFLIVLGMPIHKSMTGVSICMICWVAPSAGSIYERQETKLTE